MFDAKMRRRSLLFMKIIVDHERGESRQKKNETMLGNVDNLIHCKIEKSRNLKESNLAKKCI